MSSRLHPPAALVGAALVLACSQPAPPPAEGFTPRATRGYVLISLDTLRADHLGAYGYQRPTSPFLDSLAQRSVVFERAVVQYPATLISHMSMFTGYYPRQHGVAGLNAVLSPQIETLPERLLAAGFRTAGHTEGGFMAGGYGFARGFEEFTDTPYADDRDVERTFGRGLEFLGRLEEDEPFFVFLHTYSIHDPYWPPEPYRNTFWEGEPPASFEPTGENLNEVNKGFRDIDETSAEYFEALYDASILYVDAVLESFFEQLEGLGLADDTTVIITSDHGEEFLDHGRVVHEQVYPENIFVPLIVAHPDLDHPIRIRSLVQSIDLAPTLYELIGLDVPEGLPGRSLVPYFRDPSTVLSTEAYAEVISSQTQKTLLVEIDGVLHQLVRSEQLPEFDGTWVPRKLVFDTNEDKLDLLMISFNRPRKLGVLIDGEQELEIEVPTGWAPLDIELPDGPAEHRLTLTTDGCEAPLRLGLGEDPRCLGLKLDGVSMRRSELFDLTRDGSAQTDRRRRDPDLARRIHALLRQYQWELVAPSSERVLDLQTRTALEALGYL